MNHRKTGALAALALVLVFSSSHALAQMGEPKPELGEVSFYTGAAFGGLGGHGTVGAASGIAMSKYAFGLIDSSFIPLGSRTLIRSPLDTRRSQLWDFNFAIQIQAPLWRTWSPYLLLGSAFLYNTYQIVTTAPGGVIVRAGASDPKFGFETGAGVRYYVNEDWGIRAEYRYTISTNNFSRILGGVFYQFSGPWPFLPGARKVPHVPYGGAYSR